MGNGKRRRGNDPQPFCQQIIHTTLGTIKICMKGNDTDRVAKCLADKGSGRICETDALYWAENERVVCQEEMALCCNCSIQCFGARIERNHDSRSRGSRITHLQSDIIPFLSQPKWGNCVNYFNDV